MRTLLSLLLFFSFSESLRLLHIEPAWGHLNEATPVIITSEGCMDYSDDSYGEHEWEKILKINVSSHIISPTFVSANCGFMKLIIPPSESNVSNKVFVSVFDGQWNESELSFEYLDKSLNNELKQNLPPKRFLSKVLLIINTGLKLWELYEKTKSTSNPSTTWKFANAIAWNTSLNEYYGWKGPVEIKERIRRQLNKRKVVDIRFLIEHLWGGQLINTSSDLTNFQNDIRVYATAQVLKDGWEANAIVQFDDPINIGTPENPVSQTILRIFCDTRSKRISSGNDSTNKKEHLIRIALYGNSSCNILESAEPKYSRQQNKNVCSSSSLISFSWIFLPLAVLSIFWIKISSQ